jgi:hypothetical protein
MTYLPMTKAPTPYRPQRPTTRKPSSNYTPNTNSKIAMNTLDLAGDFAPPSNRFSLPKKEIGMPLDSFSSSYTAKPAGAR